MKKPYALLAIAAVAGIAIYFAATRTPNAAESSPKTATKSDAASDSTKPLFTVSEYDPKRDPAKDLAETVKVAQKDNRRILLLVGGNWCPWCRMIPKYMEKTEPVAAILARDYVIMKVNDSDENNNVAFLGPFPRIPAYPHLIVLDSDGKHLHSQDSEELEKGKGYDDEAFAAFLKKWSPKRES